MPHYILEGARNSEHIFFVSVTGKITAVSETPLGTSQKVTILTIFYNVLSHYAAKICTSKSEVFVHSGYSVPFINTCIESI